MTLVTDPVTSQEYYAFTLAELRAGKIAFLAGDGVATGDGGKGVKITFQIQAADDGPNLSDSDPNDVKRRRPCGWGDFDCRVDQVDRRNGWFGQRGWCPHAEGGNTDRLIGTATTHGGTLRLIVRLPYKEDGRCSVVAWALRYKQDPCRLPRPRRNSRVWLDVQSGATEADIETALGTLWLETSASRSASVRRVLGLSDPRGGL